MRVLETRISSGEREAVTFSHLSSKPCLVVSLQVITLFSCLTFSCGHLSCFGNVHVKQSRNTSSHVQLSPGQRPKGGRWEESHQSYPTLCSARRHSGNIARKKIKKHGQIRIVAFIFMAYETQSVSLLPCLADLAGYLFFGSHGRWWQDRKALASGVSTQGASNQKDFTESQLPISRSVRHNVLLFEEIQSQISRTGRGGLFADHRPQ